VEGDENKNARGSERARRRRRLWQRRTTTDKDHRHCKLYAVFMYAFANEMFIHRVKLRKRREMAPLSLSHAPTSTVCSFISERGVGADLTITEIFTSAAGLRASIKAL
jgi:hypothetical protein